MNRKNITTDVLVIGGAGAGMRAAIEAKRHGADVLLISKLPAGSTSCTAHTAGYFTYSTKESKDELFRQIVETGGYLNNQELVEVFVKEVEFRISELEEFGIHLEFVGDMETHGAKMPGHLKITASSGERLGYSMTKALRSTMEQMGVTILDNVIAAKLLTSTSLETMEGEDDSSVGVETKARAVGAIAVDLNTLDLLAISAKSTIVATGGGSCAFERTDNPPGTTGDGFALAFRAGAEFVDMECVSFNLGSSRLEEVFKVEDPPCESLLQTGACHYFLGGVKIDEYARSTVDGLYAAGEVTGGIFGAARLGGSACTDIIIFGARAGRHAGERAEGMCHKMTLNEHQVEAEHARLQAILDRGSNSDSMNSISPKVLGDRIKSTLWRYVGLVKTQATVEKAIEELASLRNDLPKLRAKGAEEIREAIETANILDVGRLVATASLERKETRGCFWRTDYPDFDNDNWVKNIIIRRDRDTIKSEIRPAVMTRLRSPSEPRVGPGCFGYIER